MRPFSDAGPPPSQPSPAPAPSALGAWFDELREGLAFQTAGRTVTEADIVFFSALTGDWHPQHSDATYAAASHFGERIAHGMLVLSYAVGLVPLDPEKVVALRRIADATFKAPVRTGDTIAVEARILGLKPVDASIGLVRTGWTIRNQHGRTVARLTVETLWRTSPVGASSSNGSHDGGRPGGVRRGSES